MPLQDFPPTQIGSGTPTTFSSGSVIFAGTTGALSQDNASFFYDQANHRLLTSEVDIGPSFTEGLRAYISGATINLVEQGGFPGRSMYLGTANSKNVTIQTSGGDSWIFGSLTGGGTAFYPASDGGQDIGLSALRVNNFWMAGTLHTALTQGSIPFVGASGAISENNASFFWDSVTPSLCIGTNHATSTSGNFCVASGFAMRARNALNTLDLQILKCEASDGLSIGSTGTTGDIAIVTGGTADITFQPGGTIACAGSLDASGTRDCGVNHPFRTIYAGTSFIVGTSGATVISGGYYSFNAGGSYYVSRQTTNSVEGFWGAVDTTTGVIFGSSTNHPVTLRQNNAAAWSISTAKAFLPASTYDIGTSGARAGTGFFTTLDTTNLTVNFTQNSILFCGASGVISQDNTNLTFSTSGSAKITAGTAFLGTWQASSSFFFLQNSALSAAGSGNYALIQSTTGQTILNSASGQNFNFRVNNAEVVIGGATSFQVQSGVSIGYFGHAVAAQQTVGANVNNVVASGTTGQFDDFTNLTTYSVDAAAIHATVSQLCRTVAQLTVAMRNYGLGA
jgi:hypothetical protein